MSAVCLFCDSSLTDRLEPSTIARITHLFPGALKSQLEEKKACTRCFLNLSLIENVMKLKADMHTALTMRLSQPDVPPPQQLPSMLALHNLPPEQQREVPPSASVFSQAALPDNGLAGVPFPNHGGFPNGLPAANGGVEVRQPTIVRKRIHSCHKCNINLKTRTYKDGLRHIQRCTGQGIRKGRGNKNPRPDVYPCLQCGRKLATREAFQVHVKKCDGTPNKNRGRKPADNTCMLCNEDQVYRHILKKHLRTKHGINAQRLDDSVLSALRTGVGLGIDSKEHVLSQIKQKLRTADLNGANGSPAADDVPKPAEETAEEHEDGLPPADLSANHKHATRSRKKGRPTKYVPEMYTCDLCTKQFEYKSQYEQHCCFRIQNPRSLATEAGTEPAHSTQSVGGEGLPIDGTAPAS